mmetsp:Transcript_8261/g.23672  ORF Transcript_8261/g.23672 Transcript_8261/m.23672 type:complete len:288 (-) Transcript_8261:7-870(-)
MQEFSRKGAGAEPRHGEAAAVGEAAMAVAVASRAEMIAAWEPRRSRRLASSNAVACWASRLLRSAPAQTSSSTISASHALTAVCSGKDKFRLKGKRPPRLRGSLTPRKPAEARKRRSWCFRASRSGSRLVAEVAPLRLLLPVFQGAFSGRSSTSSRSPTSGAAPSAAGTTSRGSTPGRLGRLAMRETSADMGSASTASCTHGVASTSSSPSGFRGCGFSCPRMTGFRATTCPGSSCEALRGQARGALQHSDVGATQNANMALQEARACRRRGEERRWAVERLQPKIA